MPVKKEYIEFTKKYIKTLEQHKEGTTCFVILKTLGVSGIGISINACEYMCPLGSNFFSTLTEEEQDIFKKEIGLRCGETGNLLERKKRLEKFLKIFDKPIQLEFEF